MKKMSFLAALVIVLWLFVLPGYALAAQGGPVEIKVSEKGFNGKAEYVLEVVKGQSVEIIFLWDDQDKSFNRHVMAIEGYDLKTGELSKDNPRQVIRFVASRSGTFRISCIFPCLGHNNLQKGSLAVKTQLVVQATPSGDKTVKAWEGPLPALSWSTFREWRRGEEGTLRARLTNSSGQPMPEESVVFYLDYSFFLGLDAGEVSGLVEIGEAITDKDGVATLAYVSRLGGDLKFQARYFGGSNSHAAGDEIVVASTTARIEEGSHRFYRTEAGISMPYLIHYSLNAQPEVGAPLKHLFSLKIPTLILAVLIGGIWLTYLRIAYRLYRVSHHGATAALDRPRFMVPVLLMLFLGFVALVLLSIILTGPDTHLNLH